MPLQLVKLLDAIQNTVITGGLVPKGAYNAGTDYAVGDSVDYLGSSYVMFSDAVAGTLPTDTTKWQVLANKGNTGAAGADGQGVPTAGTTAQILRKASNTNFDTEWHTLAKADVGLGSVDNTSDASKPVSTATQTALDLKVDTNGAIVGATKTKISYDAKGLVTAGSDATSADIADSIDKRYVTDTQLVVIGNTSGTNTGDQTLPVKATDLEINTGTDDTKFATSKALADQIVLLKTSGGNLTGPLTFSGTGNSGLKLNSLTTIQRDALTAANGMVLYNSTLNQIQKYENSQWVDIAKSPATKVISPVGSGFAADYYTDGVNDEIEIQAAIDAVTTNGGTVLVKKGTYTIQAFITIKDNVRLTGEGWGTILAGSGSTNFPIIKRIASTGSPSLNWEISNLKIDGTNVTTAAYSTSTKGIFTQYSKNCKILNVWVYNTSATGIGTDFMVRCVIDGCVVESCGRQFDGTVGGNGIGIGTGAYTEETLVISNCHALSIGNNGIMFEQQDNTIQAKYMHVVNCTAQSSLYGFRNAGAKNVTFSNCSGIKNTNDGLIIATGPIAGSPDVDACVMSNCNFSENTGSGINVAGTANTRRMLIANNILSNNTNNGLLVSAGTRYVLTGNMIFNNGKSGIRLASASLNLNNMNITANTIHNNATSSTVGDKDGICIAMTSSGQVTDIIIQSNRIFDNQGTQTQDYGINISGTHTRVAVQTNNLNGNKTGSITVGTISSSLMVKDNYGTAPVNEQVTMVMKNTSGGSLAAGDVVIIKSVAAGDEVTTTTTGGDSKVYGMATETIASTAYGNIQILGKTTLLKADGTTDIAIGDYLSTFTTAKIAKKAASGDMAFAIALETYATDDSSGVLDALLVTPRKI